MSKPGKSAHRGILPIDPTIEMRLMVNLEFVYHAASTIPYSDKILDSINHERGQLSWRGVVWSQQYAHAHISEYMEQNNIRGNIKKYVGEFY